jgi:hypothetical protein
MAWYDAIVIGVGLVGALADLVVEPTGDAQSVAAAPILPLTQASLRLRGREWEGAAARQSGVERGRTHDRSASADLPCGAALGGDLRRLQRSRTDQRAAIAVFPRGPVFGRALPDQPEPRHCARNAGLSRPGVGPGTGRLRPDRRTGHACDRRPRGFDRQRVRAVVMFTAGYAETGEEGRIAQELLAEMARQGGVRLRGPNCLGLFNCTPDIRRPSAPVSRRGRNGRGRSAW